VNPQIVLQVGSRCEEIQLVARSPDKFDSNEAVDSRTTAGVCGGAASRFPIFPSDAPLIGGNPVEQTKRTEDADEKPDPRPWVKAEIGGRHEHISDAGHKITIVERNGNLMARFRVDGAQRCKTLGTPGIKSENALARLKVQLEDKTYIPPSEQRSRRYQTAAIPKLKLPELANAYLLDVRARDGRRTADTYGSRLDHVVAFWDVAGNRRKWRFAADLDRDFVVALKIFLNQREVSRNGRPGCATARMASRTIRECVDTLRRMLAWAMRPDVRKLPSDFVQPVTSDLRISKPQKDPARANPIPIERRIAMVKLMDTYQLTHLIYPLVLAIRPEDLAGAVVEDFDLQSGIWRIGDRFEGRDFTKGHVTYHVPLPNIVAELARIAAGDATGGPMFRSRAVWRGTRQPRCPFRSNEELMELVRSELRRRGRDVQTPQDEKKVIREMIVRGGGVGKKAISNELARLMREVGVPRDVPPYRLKAAVTSDLQASGLNLLDLRYLTGHTTTDIMNEYAVLDPAKAMNKFSETIGPLLDAVRQRAIELKLVTAKAIEA